LKKKEISYLIGKTNQKGLTIVPISVYTTRRLIKVKIALVKGKKKFDKRETIKQRDTQRRILRKLKDF
jgi:SsrA-binding protein